MEFLIASALLIGTLVVGIVGNLAANEVYDRAPSIARWLVRRAASRLPVWKRARYEEEWLAHINEYEGKIGKVAHAIGCLWATVVLKYSAKKNRIHKIELAIAFPVNGAVMRISKKLYLTLLALVAWRRGRFQPMPIEVRRQSIIALAARIEFRIKRHVYIKRLLRVSRSH